MLTPLTDGDPRFIGPYRLTNRIGAGGMGAVYLGFDDHEQAAAVKVPFVDRADDPQFRERFRREVESVSRVRGSCVAQLLDADPEASQPWMAAEYVEGSSLGDAVKSRGPVEPRVLNGLAVGLADALVSIHSAGVVHRDLKPSNILLSWDGPKVIDFGIAKAEDSLDYTKTGMLVGTLVWMSPEQLRGHRAGPASDVFAWGACLAYAATGRPPFQAEGMHAIALQILNSEPDIDEVPEHLYHHVAASLSKEPEARPTANQLVAALVGRDVVNAADADSAARTALGGWRASPPTAARTAVLGRDGTRGDRDRTGLAAGVPLGYVATRQGGPGAGGTGTGGYDQGRPAGGLSPVAAAVAVIALLLVAGGIALALMLSGGDGGGDDPDTGVVPTSTVDVSQSAGPTTTTEEQPSGGPSTQPQDGPTKTNAPGDEQSNSPRPQPTQSSSAPTPTPEPTQTVAPPTTPPATTPPPVATTNPAAPTVASTP